MPKRQHTIRQENILQTSDVRGHALPSQRMKTQPDNDDRAAPGTQGGGKYYRVIVRPSKDFVKFRYQDVGDPGGILRLAGQRKSGSWDDQAWLISKNRAHIEADKLVAEDDEADEVLQKIGPARHLEGDVFRGHPRINIPEHEKPTRAQRKARRENVKKAQQMRWV